MIGLDAINPNIIRPRRIQQSHIKFDTSLAFAGKCNITCDLAVANVTPPTPRSACAKLDSMSIYQSQTESSD